VALWGGLIPDSVDQLVAMADAGVVGFKAFACPSGWDEFPPADEVTLLSGMAAAARLDVPVAVHCELEALSHTVRSEVEAVGWAAGLAARAAARLHVVHISSADAIDEARRWPGVTTETCLHYLELDEHKGRCNPPIRDAQQRQALWERVVHGQVDCIASDHSPCPPLWHPGWAGLDGVGLPLPLLLSSGRLDPCHIAKLITEAARMLRLPGKGSLEPGADADLVLVDPDAQWEVSRDTQWSRHRLSPFSGTPVKGKVVRTLVRGRTVYVDGAGPCEAGGGKFIRPERRQPKETAPRGPGRTAHQR
jgi:allantoinase